MSVVTVMAPGERVDQLAKRIYGREANGLVEALLSANPGLAATAQLIPAGTRVRAPALPDETQSPNIRPWD